MSQAHEAFFKVMNELEAIGKKRSNEGGLKYAFRGIDAFFNALHPLMAKHKLAAFPSVQSKKSTQSERPNYDGKIVTWTHVELSTIYHFTAEDGSTFPVGPIESEGLDNSDKATNKALSAGMKYALMQSFIVPTEDVEDSDATTPEIPAKSREASPKQPPTENKPVNHAPQQAGALSEAQVKRFWAMTMRFGWSKEIAFSSIKTHFKVDRPEDMTAVQYKEITTWLDEQIKLMPGIKS